MSITEKTAQFQTWLLNKQLSEASIRKNAKQAHNRILKDLGISFYEIENLEGLNQLRLDVKELERHMPNDPHRMYSNAVANYIQFMSEQADMTNTLEDDDYEQAVESNIDESSEMKIVTPQPRSPLIAGTTTRYARNPKVGADALVMAHFQCQIDSGHQFFRSRKTHQNYVEAHHLVPIAYQGLFTNGLDTVANIASLCPVCHRNVHYGEDNGRKVIITQLYHKFEPNLRDAGVELHERELLDLYRVR